jgi:hypothetical protein
MEDEKQELMAKANLFAETNDINSVMPVEKSTKDKLVDNMFEQAVIHEVANNKELKDKVLDTAKIYTETKMQTIATDVDTEHKEAVFNNKKDACESYGFNEKRTPIWAIKFMSVGYNIMLAIWLFIGSFTFMPIIFVAKKISVGIKSVWIAGVIAVLLYLGVTLAPILATILK